jgi:hypothetical protein
MGRSPGNRKKGALLSHSLTEKTEKVETLTVWEFGWIRNMKILLHELLGE